MSPAMIALRANSAQRRLVAIVPLVASDCSLNLSSPIHERLEYLQVGPALRDARYRLSISLARADNCVLSHDCARDRGATLRCRSYFCLERKMKTSGVQPSLLILFVHLLQA